MLVDKPLSDEALGWRRELHTMPETGFDEHRTSAFVAETLSGFGLDVQRGIGGTGVVATLRAGTSARSVAFRADMDALNILEANNFEHRSRVPGKMHACGHDGHMAMLLGAAKALAADPCIDGTVHFIFQPDEECGRGALAMLADGLFERFPADEIYGLHNRPQLPVGSFATRCGGLCASEDDFEIVVKGVGGHAAQPHRLVDAIVTSAQIISALQTIVSRVLDPIDCGVVSVTEVLTDGSRNVIPSTVTIRGDARSFSAPVQDEIEAKMRRIVEGVCAANAATHTFTYSREFQPVVTTEEATLAALGAARGVFGDVQGDCAPAMGSEDFAHLLNAYGSGNFAFLGSRPAGGQDVNLHSAHYDFNDNALPFGIAYWMMLARQRLAVGG